ncbi:hypothetical protein M0R45_015554 [Rubus argutus]|uniref:CC-NBS-LRR protein n=1 Tax=Rubus argutus TaxID=59490 RepID=A0AAW1XPL3_RUBAR
MRTTLTSLRSLEIHDCPELESFPEGGLPRKLETLEITSCGKLVETLKQRCEKDKGEDWPKIAHIPNKYIL